jgi:hypothetical protein
VSLAQLTLICNAVTLVLIIGSAVFQWRSWRSQREINATQMKINAILSERLARLEEELPGANL